MPVWNFILRKGTQIKSGYLTIFQGKSKLIWKSITYLVCVILCLPFTLCLTDNLPLNIIWNQINFLLCFVDYNFTFFNKIYLSASLLHHCHTILNTFQSVSAFKVCTKLFLYLLLILQNLFRIFLVNPVFSLNVNWKTAIISCIIQGTDNIHKWIWLDNTSKCDSGEFKFRNICFQTHCKKNPSPHYLFVVCIQIQAT